jgi:hypothetical protein
VCCKLTLLLLIVHDLLLLYEKVMCVSYGPVISFIVVGDFWTIKAGIQYFFLHFTKSCSLE